MTTTCRTARAQRQVRRHVRPEPIGSGAKVSGFPARIRLVQSLEIGIDSPAFLGQADGFRTPSYANRRSDFARGFWGHPNVGNLQQRTRKLAGVPLCRASRGVRLPGSPV